MNIRFGCPTSLLSLTFILASGNILHLTVGVQPSYCKVSVLAANAFFSTPFFNKHDSGSAQLSIFTLRASLLCRSLTAAQKTDDRERYGVAQMPCSVTECQTWNVTRSHPFLS